MSTQIRQFLVARRERLLVRLRGNHDAQSVGEIFSEIAEIEAELAR